MKIYSLLKGIIKIFIYFKHLRLLKNLVILRKKNLRLILQLNI